MLLRIDEVMTLTFEQIEIIPGEHMFQSLCIPSQLLMLL